MLQEDLLAQWEASVNRLIQSDEADFKVRQTEVRMLEKFLRLPDELLKTRVEDE